MHCTPSKSCCVALRRSQHDPIDFIFARKATCGQKIDLRVGGHYRFEFSHSGPDTLAFVGRYVEVVPGASLVWTNEESDDGAVTTVTFEDRAGRTLLTMREAYPSPQALDQALDGMRDRTPEQFAQLDALLLEFGTR